MSVITRHPSGGDSAAGKLASTLLSVTVAGMADPARFRRGKNYVLDDAVLRVEVRPGVLSAEVQGSRPQAYVATIIVRTVARPADLSGERMERHHVSALSPELDEMIASCTCPDDGDPCKHAVAGLLVFAQELITRPQLLVEWRCGSAEATRPTAGARARTGRHLQLVGAATDAGDQARSAAWAQFEGRDLELPDIGALLAGLSPARTVAANEAVGVDVGELVRSAQRRVSARPD
jgi:hypothetical protein